MSFFSSIGKIFKKIAHAFRRNPDPEEPELALSPVQDVMSFFSRQQNEIKRQHENEILAVTKKTSPLEKKQWLLQTHLNFLNTQKMVLETSVSLIPSEEILASLKETITKKYQRAIFEAKKNSLENYKAYLAQARGIVKQGKLVILNRSTRLESLACYRKEVDQILQEEYKHLNFSTLQEAKNLGLQIERKINEIDEKQTEAVERKIEINTKCLLKLEDQQNTLEESIKNFSRWLERVRNPAQLTELTHKRSRRNIMNGRG